MPIPPSAAPAEIQAFPQHPQGQIPWIAVNRAPRMTRMLVQWENGSVGVAAFTRSAGVRVWHRLDCNPPKQTNKVPSGWIPLFGDTDTAEEA